MTRNVVVVIGVGGMGQAIARRQGTGAHVLVADFDQQLLTSVTGQLSSEGHEVSSMTVESWRRPAPVGSAERRPPERKARP